MIQQCRALMAAVEVLCWLAALLSGTGWTVCAFTLPLDSGVQISTRHLLPVRRQECLGAGRLMPYGSTYCVGESTHFPVGSTMLRSFAKLASIKGPVQTAMERKLQEALSPVFMDIVNESAAHKGHTGNPAPHLDETHFTVRIRSEKFRGKSLVQQHRLIYDILKQELREGVHALSIQSGEPHASEKS